MSERMIALIAEATFTIITQASTLYAYDGSIVAGSVVMTFGSLAI